MRGRSPESVTSTWIDLRAGWRWRCVLGVVAPARAQAPEQVKAGRGFRRVAPGRCPRGDAGDDDAEDRRGDQERPGLAGPCPEQRRVVRQRRRTGATSR